MSAAAFTLANSAPSIPLTVVAGVNDSFVFTGDGGLASTPETFTIPAGVYTTLAECVIAMAGAFGSISGMPFAAIVTPSALGSTILLSMGSLGAEQNGNTITAAPHDVSADLGFSSPSVFAGGNDAGVFSAPRNGPCSPWITASDVLAQPGCGGAAAEVAAECAAATSELLYALSGQQFTGPCGPVTVRPMARPTDQDTRRAGTLSPLGYMSSWGSTFAYGTVLGAVSAMYGYVQPPMVELVPYPVTEIIEVWIDGVVIPPAEYQLQDFRTLVRMRPIPSFTPTERFGWPTIADIRLAAHRGRHVRRDLHVRPGRPLRRYPRRQDLRTGDVPRSDGTAEPAPLAHHLHLAPRRQRGRARRDGLHLAGTDGRARGRSCGSSRSTPTS